MSLRTFLRASLVATSLAAVAGFIGSASAQTPQLPFPVPGTAATPVIPGIPTTGIPGIPGTPGTTPGTIPGLPPISIPAPGGTPALPNIPGLPTNIKLFSPTGALLMPAMHDEATKIFAKLKTALNPSQQSIVQNIPLQSDPTKDDVNAFAGCDDSGKTYVVVTDGLYQIVDLMAQTRATDETFGTSYYEQYIKDLAAQQEGKATILPLPPGMLNPTQSLDQRKLQRQRQIFDEAIAYVVGHELGHHYLGHLGSACGGGGGGVFKTGDIVNALKKVSPAFNQPNEIAADVAGTQNVLNAGQNESDYHWSEQGGLLVIDFFKQIQDLHPGGVLFSFISTHPSPDVRAPIIKNTANWWRMTHPGASTGGSGTGGGTPSVPTKLPFPMPTVPGVPTTMPSIPGIPAPKQ